MAALQIGQFSTSADSFIVIATSRKTAAVIALAFPVMLPMLALIGLANHKFQLNSILLHSGLSRSLVPGSIAAALWIKRYWASALYALASREPPIFIQDGTISFFQMKFPLDSTLSIDVAGSNVRLKDADSILIQRRLFFIKSKQLEINLRNIR